MRKGFWWLIVLLCGIAHGQSGTVTYVYTDPQGTPLAEADASGNITATFDYRPYGGVAMGSAPSGPGYTGHVNDPDAGLVYMQARYYDPAVGRFLSIDPVTPKSGDPFSFNRHAYANNNPVMHIDPDGRTVTCDASSCSIDAHSVLEVAVDYATVAVIYTVRAVQNTRPITQESRSKPPEPLPEADGAPHSIPDGKGGYTTYPTGKATEGKQYRPDGKPHDDIPRPNVKEWKPNVAPDGTEHKGKGEVRPPEPHEIPPKPQPPPPPPKPPEGG